MTHPDDRCAGEITYQHRWDTYPCPNEREPGYDLCADCLDDTDGWRDEEGDDDDTIQDSQR